jgi:4-hydroxybenzoate polyprenyltransferase
MTELAQRDPAAAGSIRAVWGWYLIFAFLITTFREMVKDIEDIRGDRQAGCRTAPIAWGESRAKRLALGVGTGLLFFIGWHGYLYREQFGQLPLMYMGLAIAAPLIVALFGLQRARGEKAYYRISLLIKVIILTGLLLILFI